jgi:hypothetical protein
MFPKEGRLDPGGSWSTSIGLNLRRGREIGHERDRPRGVRLHGVQMGLGASGPYA